MIVISILIFLVSFALFPYAYYMKRSYVERTRDIIGQEWIIAHKEIRNWKLFSSWKHANTVFVFERNAWWIYEYSVSWQTIPNIQEFIMEPTNPDIKFERLISFDSDIKLLDFRGYAGAENHDKFWYMIRAPYGTGIFFTGGTASSLYLTGIYLTIGYNGSISQAGHQREVLLRPYLQ